MEEDQDVDDHSSKLDQKDPNIVEGQTFCLELRSSPAPCACSYIVVVSMQYRSHGRQEKCKEPSTSESSVEDGVSEMTAHDGTIEGVKSDSHDKVAGR